MLRWERMMGEGGNEGLSIRRGKRLVPGLLVVVWL